MFINDRIVLHARNAFQLNGGVCHFQTMLIGALEFRRQLAKLAIQLRKSLPPIIFGDQDQRTPNFAELIILSIKPILCIVLGRFAFSHDHTHRILPNFFLTLHILE